MWWAGSDPLDVFVGVRRVGVARGQELLFFQQTTDLGAGLVALSAWVEGHKDRSRGRLWLSGALCRVFLQEAVPGASPPEFCRIAEANAMTRTGLAGPCTVWVEPASHGAFLAVAAIESDVLRQLLAWRDRYSRRLKVRSIRPWWSLALEASLARDPSLDALAVEDQESLTLLSGKGQELDVATTVVPAGEAAEAMAARQRVCFALGLDAQSVRTVALGSFTEGAKSKADNVPALGAWATVS